MLVEGVKRLWSSTTPSGETIADLAQLTNAEVVVAVLPNLGTLKSEPP